ncbi:MAG: NAD(P)H-dependent oxidoreductase [Candidatus Paralactobacillus gallistercoris]|uniref:NAD(P)H-dependent oxidoreductase n=1 Tax=Candidatus Paralactobacillus gallistercoris TaxID=2838724 RepID=A0A948TJX4_9LACO|nr:NAD(P)H-dependent oxidoreductase [Candidatus Paralactobacillus gallistercoris]
MKTLVIIAHPHRLDSYTQTFLQQAAANLPNVTWHPLSTDLNVAQEQALLRQHQRIIWQFPLYWYAAPALLKQWEDAVLTDEFAFGNEMTTPALKGKTLGLVVNTGESASHYRVAGAEHFSLPEILRPYQVTAHRLQMHYMNPLLIYKFEHMDDAAQQVLFIRYQQYLTMTDPQSFSQQATWLAQRLQKMTMDQQLQMNLSQLLLQQQQQLDDLQALLHVDNDLGDE